MSVNKYEKHLFILPEDDANSQLAHGFLEHHGIQHRRVQVSNPAGGWGEVLKKFKADYLNRMRKDKDKEIKMLLLIDFDNDMKRLERIRNEDIPKDVSDRVFVLGVLSEPEKLRTKIRKSFAEIGRILAEGCPNSRNELWSHELLRHNEAELDRMLPSIRAFLFDCVE